jgi:hypothetical protein
VNREDSLHGYFPLRLDADIQAVNQGRPDMLSDQLGRFLSP